MVTRLFGLIGYIWVFHSGSNHLREKLPPPSIRKIRGWEGDPRPWFWSLKIGASHNLNTMRPRMEFRQLCHHLSSVSSPPIFSQPRLLFPLKRREITNSETYPHTLGSLEIRLHTSWRDVSCLELLSPWHAINYFHGGPVRDPWEPLGLPGIIVKNLTKWHDAR
jgi:hypothetical protein